MNKKNGHFEHDERLDKAMYMLTGAEFIEMLENSGIVPMLRTYAASKKLGRTEEAPEKVKGDAAVGDIVGCSASMVGRLRKLGYLEDAVVVKLGKQYVYDTAKVLECVRKYESLLGGSRT